MGEHQSWGGAGRARRILIVGGVAGGASAAAKARRVDERAEIHVFERGPYISFANCGLPYHISGEIADRGELIVMSPERFKARSEVQAHLRHEVVAIDRARQVIRVKGPDGREREEAYDRLILSQGARPYVPEIPGVGLPHVFTLRDLPDMDRILEALRQNEPRRAVVIGGGFIGLEMAEAFLHRGLQVTVVEKNPQVLPLIDADMAAYLQTSLRVPEEPAGLSFRFGSTVSEFVPGAVRFSDGTEAAADLVLLSAGVRAEVELAREAGLVLGPTGGVRTNGRMETSDPNIYAVGDAAETIHAVTGARTRIALAGPANRQGRVAGANAAGAHLTYRGALGTSIVRFLNLTVGFTGLSSKQAAAAGFSFFTSLTRDFCHAHYFPGAKPVLIKLVAEEGSGRLLGAQVIGESGVDKRVDVLATAITARMSVFDLESLDLAYAPPFGSAQDPVNVAGFVAGHIARGEIATVAPELGPPLGEWLLDVRDSEEVVEWGRLAGARHIPLHELRRRVGELPGDVRIVTYCQKGQRGYLAACALEGLGFERVANLRGGFLQARLNGWPLEPERESP
jgi:NADPH-dependent 2,4-dienoyl-CoA reductase/sulfur reductase-like enzyme/rhodanese-related sulfurtransferase